ncbi:serine-rich adhesin for platelets-like isoform X2 [Halyomorpha halys]|uniref:serine-rich adhesin for platelets-like isoform X2 n=1 Tax=Halyomorpha halys TaxID=286706 RepID=UPI0006D51AA1|nr:uncharacterized protein LOC106689041 isoform X2 [Halyomorpha halys]
MLGKLIALSKNGEEKESLPVVNLHFFIGSDLFCDLRINHKDIAAQHCLITSQKNKPALIRNLSRTVPTLVNSTEIGSSDVELKDNDIIAIRHKNYKWCYDSSSSPSRSSQPSFVVTSKNRKSWPLFKNKLVAVVPPQRRDEQNEVLPKKRRRTIAEENVSKSKSAPKVLAIKSGLRATHKLKFEKRKSSVKNTQNIERTPNVLPSLNRKSVKFLDTSVPRSRLGTRGRRSSYVTPYKCTPAKQKLSVYSTPPSSLGRDKSKPIKSILKTPSSSSATPGKDEHEEQRSDILATPLSSVPEVSMDIPSLLENELLQTPVKGNQPEIVMRSSKRKAALVRSPPSTPKSITKKRKSLEEKSIEASERAAKKLKKGPPHAIDPKKRAALLQCHRKSLTPHPMARKSGKLFMNFPSFSSRLENQSPAKTKFSPKFNKSRKSENLKYSIDSLSPTVLKYSSLGKRTDSDMILHNTTASHEKIKPGNRKNSLKSISKATSPIIRKVTRASRAARLSNMPKKLDATDVLSALDLSRRWPSPLQGEVCANSSSSQDISNLSGFRKLFSVDKTLDVRELFLEKNSESDIATEKSFQSVPETHSGRVSRRSAVLKGNQSTDNEDILHSFHSEGARDLPCSTSLLSESFSSCPSYSSTSRRSLSLKRGRKSTPSPKDINLSLADQETEEQLSSGKKTSQSSGNVENVESNSLSLSRKGRRSLTIMNGSSIENNHSIPSSKSSSGNLINITNGTHKNSVGTNHFSSPFNDTLSRGNFADCNVSQKGLNNSSSDISVFSLGSFNSSYHKSRSGDSLSLSQVSDVNVDEEILLEDTVESEINRSTKDVRAKTPISDRAHSKGRISLRRAVLLASTPKPGKIVMNDESLLSLEVEVDTKETSIHESGSSKLQRNQAHNLSTDVASGKLKKIMKKGKGFIAKTSSRFPSLPLTTDSSILKDLSPISTSVGDLRTSLRKKLNRNGSILNSLRNSDNLMSNNMDSSVSVTNSIQSTSKSMSSNHKHSVKDVNAALEVDISSSVNTSLRKQTRSSKLSLEPSQLEVSTKVKKRLQSVPSSSEDQATNILEDSGCSRQSYQKENDCKILNKTHLDTSSTSKSFDDKITSDSELADIAKIKRTSSINTSIRRGRSSNRSLTQDNTQPTAFKKRSQSLPSSTVEQTTPKQVLTVSENILHVGSSRKGDDSDNTIGRRRGRPSKRSVGPENSELEKSNIVKKHSPSLISAAGEKSTSKEAYSVLKVSDLSRQSTRIGDSSKLLNKILLVTSSASPSILADKTVSDQMDGFTPVIKTINRSIGRRGRSSKLTLGPDNSQLEKSAIMKKRSLSLSSLPADQITPKQAQSILEDSGQSRQSKRRGDKSEILNKTNIDTSLSSASKSSDNIGRRGRSSKLSIELDNSQLSALKKRSQSLPSSRVEQITPIQTLNISENYLHLRKTNRKHNESKLLNKTQIDSPSSTPLAIPNIVASDKEDSTTPVVPSFCSSVGRRGRSSKLSLNLDKSQSTTINKFSQSLASISGYQVTPKQTASILNNTGHSRRSSRKGDNSEILYMTPLDASSSTPPTIPDKTFSNIEDGTPTILTTNKGTGRRGRSSKLCVGPDDSQSEQSTIVKKRSRSLPNDQITPKQTSSILDNSSLPRRTSKKGDNSKVKTNVDTSSLSSSILLDNTASSIEDSATPIIKTSNKSIERRGRSSKLSIDLDNTQSSALKKRSRSLPSSTDEQITPIQTLNISENYLHLRKTNRKHNESKLLNKTQIDSPSSTPLAIPNIVASDKEDSTTPIIKSPFSSSARKRGRPSKHNAGPENSELKKSSIVTKQSSSLTSPTVVRTTLEQASSILEDSGISRRSTRKGDDSKIVNKTQVDASSLSPSFFSNKTITDIEVGITKSIETSSNSTIRRRGRPSKLSVVTDNSQLEKSATVKNPSIPVDQNTPKQVPSILEDSNHSKRSTRKGNDSKVLEKIHIDTYSSSPSILPDKTASEKEDNTTSIIKTTNKSIGGRGRSSKLSIGLNNSQPTALKKRSRSLPSSTEEQTTPKLVLSMTGNILNPRRSSRKTDESIFNEIQFCTLSSSSSKLSDKTPSAMKVNEKENVSSMKESFSDGMSVVTKVDGTPNVSTLSSINSGVRRGRSSKLSAGPHIFEINESPAVKNCSQCIVPSFTKEQFTPIESISEKHHHSKRSSREINKSEMLAETQSGSLSSSPTVLSVETSSNNLVAVTPNINSSSVNKSVGKRGRPSKLSASLDKSQFEESTSIEKLSQSLLSIPDDQITPKQASSILEVSDRLRQSSRKGDNSEILNKTQRETPFSTPSSVPDKATSDEKGGTTPIIKTSFGRSAGRRGRSSKFSPDNSQLEKSTIVKKRSQSLPSVSGDQLKSKETASILNDTGRSKRSTRKGDQILNKTHADTSSFPPSTLLDRTSDEEVYATPNISTSSLIETSPEKQARPSKLSVSPDNSLMEKSPILKKRSRSVPSSSDDKHITSIFDFSSPSRRSTRIRYSNKVLMKSNRDNSTLMLLEKAPSNKEVYTDSKMSTSSPVKASIGKGGITFKLSPGPDNSQMQNKTFVNKRSRSLPSSTEDQTTPKQAMSILEYSGRGQRSSRKTDLSQISKKIQIDSSSRKSVKTPSATTNSAISSSTLQSANNSTAKKGRPSKLSVGNEVKSDELSLIEDSDLQNIEAISVSTSVKKRKVEEVSPESGPTNRLSIDDTFSSLTKKKLKTSDSDCFAISSDKGLISKRTNSLETNLEISKKFGTFSSTPIVPKKSHLVGSAGKKNRSRSKVAMQFPMGLSPIIGSDEANSPVNEESTQISMICLRHSKCPSDVEERSKNDSSVVSSKMLSSEENRSHNVDVNNSSNYGTNNSKVKLSKKPAVTLSTSQNELPSINQTPVASQLATVKEDKPPPQAEKSGHDIRSLQESQKKETSNIPLVLRNKTPVLKLSPGKSRSRSRKISKNIESIEEKQQNTIIHEMSIEELIAPPKPKSDNYLSKREAEKSVNKSIISQSKSSDQIVLLIESSPERRGRHPKETDISEINKVLPVTQRRGRSAKNVNLDPPLESAESSSQKISKKKKGKKTILADDPTSSSKENQVKNIISVSKQTISEKIEQKSPIPVPKTRSKVAVLALKTSRRSVIISSPVVKSPSLKRRGGKIKSKNIPSPPHEQKQDQLAKEAVISVKEGKSKTNKVKNLSLVQKYMNIEKSNVDLSSPVKRRGRSAINNSLSKRENLVATVSKQDLVITSPHLPKRGRPTKVQGNVSKKGKDLNDDIEEPNALPLHRRGRPAVKNSDPSNKRDKSNKDPENNKEMIAAPSLSKKGRPAKAQGSNLSISGKRKTRKISESAEGGNTSLRRGRSVVKNSDSPRNKKGKSKKDPVNNNETIASPSLPKKGRSATVQDINISVSGKRATRKTSENENTSLRRGRSVVKNSDPSPNKKGKSKKDPVNNNVTVVSPSISKKGRPATKVENSNISVSGKSMTKKTSESENTSLRRGRSVVKNSELSPSKRVKSKKDPVNNNEETLASPTLPKRGRPTNKVQDTTIISSKKKPNKKGSENVEVEATVKRRGRSVMEDQQSPPDKRKRLITLQPESDENVNVDSTLSKRGRSAKRTARNASGSTDDQSTLSLQKRENTIITNSNSSAKRGKSEKDSTNDNVKNTSPSFPKRGRSAKIQEVVTASVKETSNKVSKSMNDQNISSSQRRGRSAAVVEDVADRKEKAKQGIEKNNLDQISSKKGRPAVSENVSPKRRGQSLASKQISPQLLKKKQVTTEKTTLNSSRRKGKPASSPKPEIRKVSERSKVIKKNSKSKDNKPLKSAIKKSLSKRFSRKSSLVGFIKHGRRKVHFNKNVARNSSSKKK